MVETLILDNNVVWKHNGKVIGRLVNFDLQIEDKEVFEAERLIASYDETDSQEVYKAWFPKRINNSSIKSAIMDIINGSYAKKKADHEILIKRLRKIV